MRSPRAGYADHRVNSGAIVSRETRCFMPKHRPGPLRLVTSTARKPVIYVISCRLTGPPNPPIENTRSGVGARDLAWVPLAFDHQVVRNRALVQRSSAQGVVDFPHGQTPIGASYEYNQDNNTYWSANLGSLAKGDEVTYTVNADVNGGGQKSIGPFDFTVTAWSTVTDVTGYVDNGTSVDVITGDSSGDYSPRIRIAFPETHRVHTQVAPTGSGLDIGGSSAYSVTDSTSMLEIATSDIVLEIQKSPYRLSVYEGDGTTLITRQYDPSSFRNIGWATDGDGLVTKIEDHLLLQSGERIEGFGERYDRLDQRGHDVNNWVYNQYRNQGSTGRTYLSVPFFINSGGYGVYVPTDRYAIFSNATHLSDMAGFTVDTDRSANATIDYHILTGEQPEIIEGGFTVSEVAAGDDRTGDVPRCRWGGIDDPGRRSEAARRIHRLRAPRER